MIGAKSGVVPGFQQQGIVRAASTTAVPTVAPRVLAGPPTASAGARVLGAQLPATSKVAVAQPTTVPGSRVLRLPGASTGSPRAANAVSLQPPASKAAPVMSTAPTVSRILSAGGAPVSSLGNGRIQSSAAGAAGLASMTRIMTTGAAPVYKAAQQARPVIEEQVKKVLPSAAQAARPSGTASCNGGGKLNLVYGSGKLKLGYGDPTPGKLNLGYGARGKLELSYGRQPQRADEELRGQAGKLNLSYSSQGKLRLAYQAPAPEPGKLLLSYGAKGKLNLAYGAGSTASQPVQSICNDDVAEKLRREAVRYRDAYQKQHVEEVARYKKAFASNGGNRAKVTAALGLEDVHAKFFASEAAFLKKFLDVGA